MKRLIGKHLYFGRMADREDEFIGRITEQTEVRPSGLRWFCGMHDLSAANICQVL